MAASGQSILIGGSAAKNPERFLIDFRYLPLAAFPGPGPVQS
jgi:hypothetical protein